MVRKMNEEIFKKEIERLANEYNTDVFLSPETYHGPVVAIDSLMGVEYIPREFFDRSVWPSEADIEFMDNQFLIRGSASGYLDCSDWNLINDINDLETFFDTYYEVI